MTNPERAEEIRAELKKLKYSAMQLKLDLHDLAEDLPIDWERLPAVAARTFDTYSAIAGLERELAQGATT
ncbi:CCE_0567 family metalloprotein [Candidatus Mycolicibacterium alkanivorans]|uniref:Uncharacterized protein n=1 Tax=Candidatus Mycolicibacterium alkanivorans TaxID=2954114 RepID=A0ABS9YQV9_9MYCO|nr:CCE_0567 family metalloprotein [Candidatus Mycolicibacterium alkanivorans]MCI4673634.1 hypothetical protein [Candidatus Mycolicibacterium alkanivorans]